MLIPKRVKYRKQFRGRMKGQAHRGNKVAHGDFGLVALEPSWITNRQIEAARIAMKPEWVPVKVLLNTGLPLLNRAAYSLKWAA